MPVIDRHAQIINDFWCYHDPAEPIDALQENMVLSLGQLQGLATEPAVPQPLGVVAPAGTSAEHLAPYLDRLDLVVVAFPKFRDGRGFTLARTLRNKLAFEGDIRASGHILPDQFVALVQCGVSSITLPNDHPIDQWKHSVPVSPETTRTGPLLQRLLREKAVAAEE